MAILTLRLATVIMTAAVLAGGPARLAAQVVSPGKLSSAHASLEGVRNCTQCHELKQRGSSVRLCLSCHEPLRERMARGSGFHATLGERSCGECHKEHLGREFDVLRLDSARFVHAKTGYELSGKHAEVGCRSCHAPEHVAAPDVRSHPGGPAFLSRTFLGLPRSCVSCHTSDSPHERQFAGQDCNSCHREDSWERAPKFLHARAAFKLTGAHATVECGGCHKAAGSPADVRWNGLAFSTCTDCHRDPHANRMGASCTRCHTTGAWLRLTADLSSGFDHGRTGYALRGAHEKAECARCHAPARPGSGVALRFSAGSERATYPRPIVKDCASCHLDPHPRAVAVASPQSCAGCHTERSWSPTLYGPEKHGRTFALDGAHRVAPCLSCHRSDTRVPTRFTLPAPFTCVSCHQRNDPHKGRFGTRACAECHTTRDWKPAQFDHKRAARESCASCHANDDPHNGQFVGANCAACHGTSSFRSVDFDHKTARFKLDGGHEKVSCGSCHSPEQVSGGKSFVRYKPLESSCRSCHRSEA